jgi:hypothetical protein
MSEDQTDHPAALEGCARRRPAHRRDLHGRPGACSAAQRIPPPGMHWPAWVEVASAQPVLACLGSQYAGWSLAASKEETGGKKFFALGSGPVRALAGKEALFAELGYRDEAGTPRAKACWCWRSTAQPPQVVLDKILRDCGRRDAADADPDADHQPGRHHAGGGPRARGGAAQGA